MQKELEQIQKRYDRRDIERDSRYNPLLPSVYMAQQEKLRALIRLFKTELSALDDKAVLEIGCGSGMNLLQLIQLGFRPENLTANELLNERLTLASHNLPSAVKIIKGDASAINMPANSYDIVYQSTVFSSILDDRFQAELASVIWRLLKPGGAILWYDFVYNNPKNNDVRGVPYARIKELFPDASITRQRVTLAPPISRLVTRMHPILYTIFNTAPFLRTHVLCWIKKKGF
jgi:ubiquinone/menaquinone biosynthesis C-methylase UbiE